MLFYAVKRGRTPGVYNDWNSCKREVQNYPMAVYKKFNVKEEALKFVKEENCNDGILLSNEGEITEEQISQYTEFQSDISTDSVLCQSDISNSIFMLRMTAKSLSKTAQSLSVGINRLISQIDKIAAVKSTVGTFDCAERRLSSTDNVKNMSNHGKRCCTRPNGLEDAVQVGGSGVKKAKRDDAGFSHCGFSGAPFQHDAGIPVYTDGAALNNGMSNAKAGFGVYWGADDPSNVSMRLKGAQTNNRAEIRAAIMAVKQAKEKGVENLILYTDSEFLIKGITIWIHKWKKNGWKASTGANVINRDDFETLDDVINGINIEWVHVYGHGDSDGNNAADRLANEGARSDYT